MAQGTNNIFNYKNCYYEPAIPCTVENLLMPNCPVHYWDFQQQQNELTQHFKFDLSHPNEDKESLFGHRL